MKNFEVYRNIRKRAMIWGLPVSLFALMMLSIIGSLLVIIFSFNLGMIILAFISNILLYILLTKLSRNPYLFQVLKVFPRTISSKRLSDINYEQD
ncbi:hypothetical protein [Salegentibacter maritimus]|uniref:hypothetical protein n=1 Tax=Salegentibacter maritimus TaxID=2794347 RepID=UPI0018E463FB|nr:hypothetical protein [Salegentibacter maritimus]MBI6116008.1 hypothetical protein [Salegentibacter maritimus]